MRHAVSKFTPTKTLRPLNTNTQRRLGLLGGVLALGMLLPGCSLMPHALQPQQLWKLNRQAPASGDAYFSVPAEDAAATSSELFESTTSACGSKCEMQD